MVELCTQWFRDAVERCIRPEMPRLLAAHRDAGHRVCLLTASTPYVAVPLCERLGIQDWIASRLEVVDGVFTGQPVKPVCFGAGKIHWAGQWALEHGIDLSRSFFYTDSMTDLPMLEAVGRPVLVNPDRKLRREGLVAAGRSTTSTASATSRCRSRSRTGRQGCRAAQELADRSVPRRRRRQQELAE